ncbi:hypothetical protein DFH07DRAFT_783349 [Mycena maculata]|uniref:Uncharacterized protein n=1 Tax=Mycena maculata TaxID=230809 RepID=A0AAD7MMC7_9AGAR|nr:hypothetical protein DFH07DRAFT_783349 [Mycena maculata]
MLVEKTAFEVNATGTDEPVDSSSGTGVATRTRGTAATRGRGGRGRGRRRGRGKGYAVLHGQKRGSFGGKDDAVTPQPEPTIPVDAPGEGIYIYIQSTTCRRAIQAAIFRNEAPNVDPLKCCDLCNPRLFDWTRPPRPLAASRQQAAKKGLPVDSVRQALYGWRRSVKKEKFPHALFSPQAILDNDTCGRLSSIGPVNSLEQLSQLLGGWARWETLGETLFTFMASLSIPESTPATRKRPADESQSAGAADKRARIDPVPAAVDLETGGGPIPPPNPCPRPSVPPPNLHPRPSLLPPPPAKCPHLAGAGVQPTASTSSPITSTPRPRNHPGAATPGSSFHTPSYHPNHGYQYPAYYPPAYWQSLYPFNAHPQWPATPQAHSVSGSLAGNPYASLMTPSPLAQGPLNSSSQPRGPAPAPSNPLSGDASPSG